MFVYDFSYLEIYNERVLDLLRGPKDQHQNLRVREHPKEGPYVQGNLLLSIYTRSSLLFLTWPVLLSPTTVSTHPVIPCHPVIFKSLHGILQALARHTNWQDCSFGSTYLKKPIKQIKMVAIFQDGHHCLPIK